MRGWIILNGLVGVSSASAIVSGMTSSIGIKSLSVLSLVLLGLYSNNKDDTRTCLKRVGKLSGASDRHCLLPGCFRC